MPRSLFALGIATALFLSPSAARADDEGSNTLLGGVMTFGGLTMTTSSLALRLKLLEDTREFPACLPGVGIIGLPFLPLVVLQLPSGRADGKDVAEVAALALSGILELGGGVLTIAGLVRLLRDRPRPTGAWVSPYAAPGAVGIAGRW